MLRNSTSDFYMIILVDVSGQICIPCFRLLENKKEKLRCEQGSNLCGNIPLDFESNALTTRPSQLDASMSDRTVKS